VRQARKARWATAKKFVDVTKINVLFFSPIF